MLAVFFVLFTGLLLTSAVKPKLYGPYTCKNPTTVKIGGLKAGGSQDAYLMYPETASATKKFPFIGFAHGMTAGGTETYSGYPELWHSVCSYGYIVLGPMSCPSDYCQTFWEDVMHTIQTAQSEKGKLAKELDYALWDKIGVYGHSMGGAATVHVSGQKIANLTAAVALHPSVRDDFDQATEAKQIKIPMLWFTGDKDNLVPASSVWKYYGEDTIKPKLCAELKGVDHFDCTGIGPNTEDAYVGSFFDCLIKDSQQACSYFWGGNRTANICDAGPAMTKCQVDQK